MKTAEQSSRYRWIALVIVFACAGVLMLARSQARDEYTAVDPRVSSLEGAVTLCPDEGATLEDTYMRFSSSCDDMPLDPWDNPPQVSEIKIATLGDSNTESGYWRQPFQKILKERGCSYDTIGQFTDQYPGIDLSGYDRDHDANSGAVIATSRNPGNAIFSLGSGTIASKQAHIAFVVGGTNDIRFMSSNVSQILPAVQAVVDEAKQELRKAGTTSPETYFYVVAIVQISGKEELVDTYNAMLQAAVEDLASEMNVRFIDTASTAADLGGDGIHFSLSGGARYGSVIGNETAEFIEQFGVCSS